jgi:hypothetical protein
MRKKSRETHEKQIRSMSVLSSTSHLTVKITQYVLPCRRMFNLNQTVIASKKVTLKEEPNCSIRIGFHSKDPNGRPVAGLFNRGRVFPRGRVFQLTVYLSVIPKNQNSDGFRSGE